jgi:hypothetical protein
MKQLALGMLLATMLGGCATSPTVTTDHDPAAQFGSYQTYAWLKKPEANSPLIQQRIVSAVDAKLQARGWRQAAESSADVVLVANVATTQKQSIDTFYNGPAWGGWGWGGMGMGSASTTVRTYDVGTQIVDMFDTKTKQAVWRGTASATVPSSVEKANTLVQAGVDKMFATFPPGSAPAK